MSDSHRLTLRKKRSKRPEISGPTAVVDRPGLPSNPSTKTRPARTERAPSETADLVKRRYSTRYNQLPQFGDSDVPDVPTLPTAHLRQRSQGAGPHQRSTSQSQLSLTVDQSKLGDPNLQHDKYVASILSNASEQEIQEYQNNLRRIKNRTSVDLQQNVYQNRTQFMKISKEAERLKSEMTTLRGLMGELTAALGQSTTSASNSLGGGSSSSRRAAHRSSVANLESMWSTQLQALWKHVERSQKFLPATPGRHIVMETGSWIELDSATWKPKRPVHIVLLNDHLLVASKKRKKLDPNIPNQGPAPTKLVAEECWPLQDIDIVDMAASVAGGPTTPQEERAIATAITIRSGNKALTYRHEKRDLQAKSELLMALRKAVEDLRKANMPALDKPNSRADTLNYLASKDLSTANKETAEHVAFSRDKPDVLIEVDGKQQNFRWIEAQMDELDIDIALQRFNDAVERVEKLRSISKSLKSNSIAQELVTLRVDERAAKLANILSRDLVDTPSFMEATKRSTSYLIRLGFEDKARDLYLAARGDTLTQRARQCVFDGDLHRYVFGISYVYFTIIKNTVVIFQACFAPVTMSACIRWANEHLETFNALLVRQLSSVEKGGKVWSDCMDVVWNHEREMLGEVGLDFREVIGRSLDEGHVRGSSTDSRGGQVVGRH